MVRGGAENRHGSHSTVKRGTPSKRILTSGNAVHPSRARLLGFAMLRRPFLDAGWTLARYSHRQMDDKADARREDAFVLRMWREAAAHEPPWRALVQHLQSGERRFFTNYGELCEFLDRFTRG